MKRLLALAACLAALLAPGVAQAHPLGNFTINRHTTIELSGGRIYVHYALDLAEIPTLQSGKRVRAAGFAAEAARGLELRVDGKRAPLRVLEHRVVERPGAGGLKTLRFDAVYEAAATGTRLAFRDRNFGSRIGWKEVVVRAERRSCAPRGRAFRRRAGATTSAPTRRICSARRSTSPPRPRRSGSAQGDGHAAGARRRTRRPSIAAAASRR